MDASAIGDYSEAEEALRWGAVTVDDEDELTKSRWSLCLMLEFSWSAILEAAGSDDSGAV